MIKGEFFIMHYKLKKGFSLLEIILVLAIAAAFVIAGLYVYNKATTNYRTQQELKNINTILSGIHSLYTGTVGYKGLSNSVLMKAQVFPDNMLYEEATNYYLVQNTYKGRFTVSVNGSSSGGEVVWSAINMSTENIPTTDCTLLASAIYNSFGSNGALSGLSIDGNSIYLDMNDEYSNINFDLDKAANICNKGDSDIHNILLTFK